jgi:hypothetical protein
MSFWQHNMPAGMLLRSPYPACNIDAPGRLTMDDFARATGAPVPQPVPLDRFIEFGRWVQAQAVPDVDERSVTRIERSETEGFTVTLEDDERLSTHSVVVAAGIAPFARVPTEFCGVPQDAISHSVDEPDLARFAGMHVAVIGAGQSALESAALLHELGAQPEVLARGPVRFVQRKGWLHRGPARLLHNRFEIGPAGLSHLVTYPRAFTRIPRETQNTLAARAIRPVGAAWLEPRLRAVSKQSGVQVVRARAASGNRASLDLADGATREFDHVLLATGYRIDIAEYGFLAPELLTEIKRVNGYPRLRSGFESSVSNLHFIGAPSAWSNGPLVRFVCGTTFTAPRLAATVARHTSRRSRLVLLPSSSAA